MVSPTCLMTSSPVPDAGRQAVVVGFDFHDGYVPRPRVVDDLLELVGEDHEDAP
jgi:hypothetical protein